MTAVRSVEPAGLSAEALNSRGIFLKNLLRRYGDAWPFVHLHTGDKLVAAIRRAEDRGLALFHVEPVLAERRDDVRLMRDENRVGVSLRCRGKHLAKCLGAPAVLVRRHDQAALGQIRRL